MESKNANLSSLLTASGRLSSSDLKTQLVRLSSSLRERQVRGASASFDYFNSALSALSLLKGTTYSELRLSCLMSCGHFFYVSGFKKEALRAAHALEALAEQGHDKSWIRKARNLRGIVAADIGNVSEAIICYTEALSLAREMNDLKGEVLVLGNLGSAFSYGGLPREAIECLQKVVEQDSTDAEIRDFQHAALANIARVHLQNENYNQAQDAMVRWLALATEPHDAHTALNRTTTEFAYFQIALGLGKLSLARERLAECIRFSHWGDSPRSRFMATLSEGLYEVHAGNVAKGIARLEEILTGTESDEVGHMRMDCLGALVNAFDAAGRPEIALRYLHELLSHVRSKRQSSALALLDFPASKRDRAFGERGGIVEVLERHELRLRVNVAEREIAQSRLEMFERLAVTADLREDESGEHGYRVGKLASLVAEGLNWNADASLGLELAARLHDIGKIGVPDRILLKSQELKDAERHFIGTHTVIGAELLGKSNMVQLKMAEDVARYHHEWWDGSGYPSNLRGKRIPIHARIVALADVFDALTHGRPYSAAWTMDQALEEIRNRRGTQFDPDLTDRFLDLVARLRIEHKDLDAYLAKAAASSPFAQARNKIRAMLADEHANELRATQPEPETVH